MDFGNCDVRDYGALDDAVVFVASAAVGDEDYGMKTMYLLCGLAGTVAGIVQVYAAYHKMLDPTAILSSGISLTCLGLLSIGRSFD